jgi:hypothetical protein
VDIGFDGSAVCEDCMSPPQQGRCLAATLDALSARSTTTCTETEGSSLLIRESDIGKRMEGSPLQILLRFVQVGL